MCSYLGSFPPRVPRILLNRWHARRRSILDPFCGGGTTLLEAGSLGYSTIGVDLNPLAVILAKAKTKVPPIGDLKWRLNELARDFEPEVDVVDVSAKVSQIFHHKTLQQLVFLKRRLDLTRADDVFLMGSLLGILHGKSRKGGTSAYLSIDMPNTFSMAPNYVREFVEKNGLKKPPADVFGKLRDRIEWLLRDGAPYLQGTHQVFQGDGAQIDRVLRERGIRHVGGIVTSPPYLGVLRYGTFNWIRLWLLNEDAFAVDSALDTTDSLDRYISFIASFLQSASRVLRKGSCISLVIGDVDENGQHLALADRVWEEVSGIVPFELEELTMDSFNADDKTTRIWGKEKKGRATDQDRFLTVRKV